VQIGESGWTRWGSEWMRRHVAERNMTQRKEGEGEPKRGQKWRSCRELRKKRAPVNSNDERRRYLKTGERVGNPLGKEKKKPPEKGTFEKSSSGGEEGCKRKKVPGEGKKSGTATPGPHPRDRDPVFSRRSPRGGAKRPTRLTKNERGSPRRRQTDYLMRPGKKKRPRLRRLQKSTRKKRKEKKRRTSAETHTHTDNQETAGFNQKKTAEEEKIRKAHDAERTGGKTKRGKRGEPSCRSMPALLLGRAEMR